MAVDAGAIEDEPPNGTSSASRTAQSTIEVNRCSRPLKSTITIDRFTIEIRRNANRDGQQWQDECASSAIIRQLPAETEAAVVFGHHSVTDRSALISQLYPR